MEDAFHSFYLARDEHLPVIHRKGIREHENEYRFIDIQWRKIHTGTDGKYSGTDKTT